MKHIVSLFISLFFLAHVTFAITPITGFYQADYSGGGDWLAQDGSSGSFYTFLAMEPDSLTMAMFDVDGLHVYKTLVDIDADGFLTAETIDESDPMNPIYYPAYGNCGTHYCQINTYLYNGNLWQAFAFGRSDTISFLGSINFDDTTPNVQWEGSLYLLP